MFSLVICCGVTCFRRVSHPTANYRTCCANNSCANINSPRQRRTCWVSILSACVMSSVFSLYFRWPRLVLEPTSQIERWTLLFCPYERQLQRITTDKTCQQKHRSEVARLSVEIPGRDTWSCPACLVLVRFHPHHVYRSFPGSSADVLYVFIPVKYLFFLSPKRLPKFTSV